MSQVMEWIKANIFIVIFAVLMIGALVALPFISSGMNESVRSTVNARAKLISEVRSLEKTNVEPPQAGRPVEGQTALVNGALLEQYRQAAEELRGDADAVVAAALAFNQKDHRLLMSNIFPEMPPFEREVLPLVFYGVIEEAYDRLLEEVRMGVPPTRSELAMELRRAEVNFINQSIQKDSREDLDEEELEELKKKLTQVRLAKNREQAERIGFYMSRSDVPIPVWYQQELPSVALMFNWNWEFWVVSDILMALHHANEADETVLLAPVKRVMRLAISGLPDVSTSAAPRGRGKSGAGGRDRGGESSNSSDEADSGALPDPSKPIKEEFGYRFTGRNTNPLYDIIEIQIDLVVDSTRIPQVLDVIARENFFTVVDLKMQPIDPFDEAGKGFMYGNSPVCKLELTLDTVWLRQWTTQDMPNETRQKLEIPLPKPPPADNDG